jgi:hypothetical protein
MFYSEWRGRAEGAAELIDIVLIRQARHASQDVISTCRSEEVVYRAAITIIWLLAAVRDSATVACMKGVRLGRVCIAYINRPAVLRRFWGRSSRNCRWTQRFTIVANEGATRRWR